MTNYDPNTVDEGFDSYQEMAATTAIYPSKYETAYPLLGLAGEVGEFANMYKKVLRDGVNPKFTEENIVHELGDILWYLSNIASDLGISLGYIANKNLEKLLDRQQRGVLGGSGDNR